jgi:hypothetical protein
MIFPSAYADGKIQPGFPLQFLAQPQTSGLRDFRFNPWRAWRTYRPLRGRPALSPHGLAAIMLRKIAAVLVFRREIAYGNFPEFFLATVSPWGARD